MSHGIKNHSLIRVFAGYLYLVVVYWGREYSMIAAPAHCTSKSFCFRFGNRHHHKFMRWVYFYMIVLLIEWQVIYFFSATPNVAFD